MSTKDSFSIKAILDKDVDLVKIDGKYQVMKKYKSELHARFEINIYSIIGSHPNICRFIESAYTEKGDLTSILEYCNEGDIFGKLKLSEESAQQVLRQILPAVKHIHDKGIVHYDIKPENILCHVENGVRTFKLTDFGLSHQIGKPLAQRGTPEYVAPEIVRELKIPTTGTVDVWCIGILAYDLMCGTTPFQDKLKSVMSAKILKCVYDFPFDCSPEGYNFITGCLQPDPSKRLTIEQLLSHPWLLEKGSLDGEKVIFEKNEKKVDTRTSDENKPNSTMETFLEQLSVKITELITSEIKSKLSEFADKVASEGKLSREQVLEIWNTSHPELKVNTLSPSPKSGERVKTDKDRKCPYIKVSGINAGEPCGKNCVAGEPTCKAHIGKKVPEGGTAPTSENEVKATEKKTDDKPKCQHIMLSGANKDKPCGKALNKDSTQWCTVHKKQHDK